MKGGMNKLMRNVVALKGGNTFEKVIPNLIFIFSLIEIDQGHLPSGFKRTQGETCHV